MKNNIYIKSLLLVVAVVMGVGNLWADGSKDLYPNGADGYRAFLRSAKTNTTNQQRESWPFPNEGVHYVYAKSGETITLASSVLLSGNAKIKLYAPNGDAITLNISGNSGQISNRTAEKAGPLRPNETANNNKYTPIYHLVTVAGVYRVEFIAQGTGDPGTTIVANDNWTQGNNSGIAAWDVSVVNAGNTGFVAGRVYTKVLNLSNGYTNPNSNGFYGLVYVQTKDGYTYKVNNNGNNGMYFTFFVNNNGFVDATTQLPIYKSINTTTDLGNRVHNPNNADVGTHLTHKLFYTTPSTDMPVSAPIAVTSNGGSTWTASSTWLNTAPVVPNVSVPVLTGVDGKVGQVSNKGGFISFNADVQGNYKIEIISTGTPSFPTRTITGQASAGNNSILWDGKDGAGNTLPNGTFPAKVTVQLQGAEVHFPFFDMEYNTKGTIIELTNGPNGPNDPDRYKVYWDDTPVRDVSGSSNGSNPNPKNNSHLPPTNSTGISSLTNGHIWGVGATGTSGQFGDEKSIDTWTFITGQKKESQTTINVKIADLYIGSISTGQNPGEPIRIGDEITYTVVAGNKPGSSDVEGAPFSFILPPGFAYEGDPNDITFTSSCGDEAVEVTYDTSANTFNSQLNLPAGCEVTYTFKAKVTSQATSANTTATVAIMRPADVTDPDATNTSDPSKPPYSGEVTGSTPLDGNYYYHPTNPFFEVNNNGVENNTSNNIENNRITDFIDDLRADNDINQTPVNVPVSGNVLTNDYSSNGILNVGSAKYYDDSGVAQTLTLGTETTVYTENGVKAGTITLNSNGDYTFMPAEGFVGDVPVEYTAINGAATATSNNSDDARLTVTVIPATVPGNNPPIALDDVATTKKGVTLTGDVLSNDSDPDGNSLTVTGATQGSATIIVGTPTQVSGKDIDGNVVPNAGSITINANGKIEFVPNGDFVGTVDPVEYAISDGKGGTDKANIYITVIEDHGNTTFANDDANSAKKGVTMTGNVLDNDFDPEGNTQGLTSVTIGGVTTVVDSSNKEITISGKGKLTVSPNGEYTFVPEPDFVGTVVVGQTVCDDGTPVACDNATLYLTSLPESDNSTTAVDDFFETGNNKPMTGNVMENDYDNEGHDQKVTTTGTISTTEGGTVTIDEDGNFTYTPPADKNGIFDTFTYTVCDDGTPQACDDAVVTIAVGICYEGVSGKKFKWSYEDGTGTATETIAQPAADYGFTFDIYELDNSFNMKINGVQLADDEIEFQSENTAGINIMFADGDEYEIHTYKEDGATEAAEIWEMRGNKANPLIRVVVSHTGKVTMYGSKVSYGSLFPLKFIESKGNKFNTIDFSNAEGQENEIIVTQNRVGKTVMDGYGYGRNKVDCPNYWHGYNDNEWADNSNWTDNYVPKAYEDIEFATEANNSGTIQGMSGPGAGKGAAKEDLHLDNVNHSGSGGRIVKDLINDSNKDLVITTTNQLIIDGKVHDKPAGSTSTGTIVVKADEEKASGTLLFSKPDQNANVGATVEFYNKAYTCPDCGFYRKQWQYFGIPVKSAEFPYIPSQNPLLETINKWTETVNGNKWVALNPANTSLEAFKGYEINNSNTTKPAHIYDFKGILNVGDQMVGLTKTANVNYSGMNLLANSFTAAIPISEDAITGASGALVTDAELAEKAVYLFNAGTRDQWRKLNGGSIAGVAAGQYTAVPVKLGGQAGLPDRILSMHSFMVNAGSNANITLKYDQLVKNETNGVNQPAWRSTTGKKELPYIVLDVIGEGSADRVWLFEESSATRGFDNGWDGYKMLEEGLIQTFVSGSDQSKYQVATVPQMDGTTLGVSARNNESYVINMSVASDVEVRRLYLHDTFTGRGYLLKNGAEIVIPGSRSTNQNRFKITSSSMAEVRNGDDASIINTYVRDNVIVVENRTDENATVSVYDISGRFVGKSQIRKDEIKSFHELSMTSGVMVVKVVSDSGVVSKSDRVLLK